jgi:hypothetical protein
MYPNMYLLQSRFKSVGCTVQRIEIPVEAGWNPLQDS